ncbi:TPA: hypothetical protein ACSP2K_002569 [Aeromonas veronii]|uniref:hypothetical protein n=1 Tax=uncultured Aeromonas sp. TaxID=263763 RepID=UPI002594E6B8|nr:hypothetical protein [uncultured Aeromonas sp.]
MQRFQYFYPDQVVTLSCGGYRITVKPLDDEESNDTCCVWFNPELGGKPVEWTFPSILPKLEENQELYGYGRTLFKLGDNDNARGAIGCRDFELGAFRPLCFTLNQHCA